MAETNEQASCCTFISVSEAEACKLPLLDGQTSEFAATITTEVELGNTGNLTDISQRDRISFSSIVCTAWALLLRCYTGQGQVTFEYKSDDKNTITPYLRTIFDQDDTLSNYTGKTKDAIAGIERKRRAATQSIAATARSRAKANLVNTTVCIHESDTASLLDAKAIGETSKGHVTLLVETNGGLPRLSLRSWSSDASSIYLESLANTFSHLLKSLSQSPSQRLKALDYLSDVNEQQLKQWNEVSFEHVERCVNDVIYGQVQATPDSEAICAWDGSLTYRNLWRYVHSLAQNLANKGIGPCVIVPVCFEKSVWAPVAMLAVMEAGAAFCPLDASQPLPRLKSLVGRLGAKTLLCSTKYRQILLPIADEVLPVDAEVFEYLPETLLDKLSRAAASDAAYVLWTSGSTGEPKGVVIEHRAYCASANAHAPAFGIHSTSRVLQYASYVFDASIIENFTTLMVGATICIPSDYSRLNGLSEALNQMRVTYAQFTPSVVNFLDPSEVPHLKTVLLMGEGMSRDNMMTWSKPGVRLLNAYGPAECSVAATVNPDVPLYGEPSLIGHPLGVKTWVVDAENHARLLPPGCIGELLVEGPTLARGYLNDADRTREAFVENPAWVQQSSDASESKRRMYKTGDLVRYRTSNGMLYFIGRKDTQVKHHGQRIELGDIEHHLRASLSMKRSVVVLPKVGLCSGRLVAAFSLEGSSTASESRQPVLADRKGWQEAEPLIDAARERLSSQLPAFMLPSIWLPFQTIPLLASGKMDRKALMAAIQDISDAEYSQCVGSGETLEDEKPATDLEEQLRLIWSHVLNLQPNQIGLKKQSFLSLGGDSISAMMVQSHCKKRNIGITVQDILRAKSIAHLSTFAETVARNPTYDEKIEEDFDLSPIQSLYFELPRERGHFNQSFFVRLKKPVEPALMHQAVKTLVNRHSMLRARFHLSALDDEWKQRITSDVAGSYSFNHIRCASKEDAVPAMSKSQTSLDPVDGPLFAVDLFDVSDGDQLLFMTAHHLVVDLVSWRVLLEEVEELLTNPTSGAEAEPCLSFQAWCRLQQADAQKVPINTVLPTSEIPTQSFEYWGVKERENTYGNVACKGFELDAASTSMLMSKCHEAFRTEPLDFLLAAMIHSFSKVFTDRVSPAIFNEGHGREVWDRSIDLSRTVGWFTTMYPIYVASAGSEEFTDTLRRVKDYRRAVPGNGRPYFASRLLTAKGAKRFGGHWPLEITFNYLGTYQQLERADALLVPAEEMAGEARAAGGKADYGRETPRFGLFEISAVIVQGKLRYSFTFNQGMKHLDRVDAWISGCEEALHSMPSAVASMPRCPTLSDYPLLAIDYEGLQKLTSERLPSLEMNIGNVEDIYRCSQIQQGLLISTKKDAGMYAVEGTYEVKPADAKARVESGRLAKAWQNVVNRHPSLRTLFIESSSQDDALYDQLVLQNVDARIERLFCGYEDEVEHAFIKQPKMQYTNSDPAHRLTICETANGKVFFKLEISHTLIDGASMSIIYKEIVSSYEGKLLGDAGPSYSSYISFLQKQPLQAGLRYWKSFLAGVEPTSFPVLIDISAGPAERKLRSQRFNYEELDDLQVFCELHGVTMANVFHIAWALTLQAYTGSKDVCYGYLISVRDPAVKDIDKMVGYLVNMVVCRVVLSPNMPITEVMRHVQKDLLEAQDHRQTALADVLHALKLSGDALFNTSLSYRKLPPAVALEKHEISLEEHRPYYDPTEYNVSINIEVSEEAAAIDLDYWTDSLSDGHANNVANTFFHALRNIVGHSEKKLGQLNGVSAPDRQLIMSWNEKIPQTIHKTVHEVVSEQVALRPNKEAICAWDASFTFKELDTLAEKLAGFLRILGVGAETFVCLCCEKSAYTPVTMLGVLKAGGAFASLDPMHPTAALDMRIKDTQAKVILTSPCYNALFDGMGLRVVSVDAAFLDQLLLPETPATKSAEFYNPCCTIYTSGSTGKPKGVVLEHSALVTSAAAHGHALGMDETTRFLQYASYTFDNCLEETFTTLMRGGTVCVPSDHDRMNDVAGACTRLNANWIDLTPTVAMYLNPAEMRSVKKMSLGGEALTKAVLEVWANEVQIHAQYGPCECSINSTHRIGLHKDSDPTSIGKSVGSVSWIVDPSDHDRLVPIGCEGELLIEGPILARGYLNDTEKTDKAFIKDPEWSQAYRPKIENHAGPRRMYKTGDLVRYNADGTMDYCGRKDHQIKLHGQRIELGEIEYHVKNNLPPNWQFGVELVAPSSLKMLALFACPQKDASATTMENILLPMSTDLQTVFRSVEAALTKSLPKAWVPSMYIPLASLPLSSSGKLDRKQLKALAQALSENQIAMFRLAGNSGRKPSTEVEKTLAALWESLLKLEAGSIGMDSQFFRMGGDSIAAIRLVTIARSKGISLTVANIFRNATFSEMCASAEVSDELASKAELPAPVPFELLPANIPAHQVIKEVSHLCRAEQHEVADVYPCTPMQEGLIALSSKKPGAYVAQTTYRMTNVDVEKFKTAWQAVVASENILRTRIVFTESLGFLQTIVNKPIVWSAPEDLDHLFDAKEFQGAYSGGSLSDYAIVKGKDANGFFFVWTIHHALYDRWSIPLILQKVRTHYYEGSFETAAASTKAPMFPQFIRFLLNEDKAESAKFWQSRLAGTMSPQYPALPKPTYQPSATGRFLNFMPISRRPGAEMTMPMLIRSAWGLTISAYSNSDDVVFGEIFSGRDTPLHGIEDMTGPAFATVPIRVQAKRDLKVQNYLQQFQKDFTQALPYQHMGLLKIKRIDSDASNACEFQNLISINNEVPDTSDLFELEQAAGSGSAFFTYGLTVSFDVHATEIELEAHYDPLCISQWQVERLLQYFEYALTQLSSREADSSTLGEMRMLHADDEAIIRKWNSVAPMHVEKCVHEIVHEKAETMSLSSPAICAWDGQFTYRELDRIATSFAHYLLGIGVGRQSYVPVCFEKTALVVISMLAIMKVGAAFVPIDGEAPKARLQGIVQDADATHVLCSPKNKELCDSLGPRTVVVDHQTVMNCPKNHSPFPYYTSADIAYIIFTSGSTGKPKGTLVSHSAFSSGAFAHGPAMGMQTSSRVLQFASFTFDASVMEILSTLLMGGCVCIPDDKTRLNDVAKAINDLNVNWALLTPSFAKMLSPSTVPGLKTLVLGGEAMSQSDVQTWADQTRLVNAYGPSETAVVAAVNSHVTASSKFSCIGTAVGGRCFIVNQHNHDELVPVGAAGELVVQGPILASGYLKERVKTEAAFVPGPAWLEIFKVPGMRAYGKIYKTGDLVRYAEDGSILYSGRKDNQTKLHGQRLELGEIEHHLRHDPAVQHAMALIPATGHYAKRLVAVISFKEIMSPLTAHDGIEIVAQADAEVYVAKIKDHLRSHLQPFMVPSNWVTLVKIPMLPSGKLDSKRIKGWLEAMPEEVNQKISGTSESSGSTGIAASEMEERLQKIWSKALDLPLEKTGLETNFLFLGGDSISALQVLSKCRAEGISTTVQDIIRSSSIRQLAGSVSVDRAEVKYADEEFGKEFALSPMQRLYFDWVGSEQVHHFNQSVVLRLPASQSVENITSALETLVQSHSMLRASFQKDASGHWTQKLDKDSAKSYRFMLHSGKSSPQEIAYSIETSQKSLNIGSGPLFAANLFEWDECGSRVLVLVAHHLVIDIVSWNILQQDLESILTTKRAGTHKSLPFQTWCQSQQDHSQAELSRGLDFEDEVPMANFSYWGMETSKNVYGTVRNLELELDSATTTKLLGACSQAIGGEMIDILLGSVLFSFCKTFSDRKSSPAVFNEAHGREPWDPKLDLSHTVGWFTTISPVFLPSEASAENDIVNAIRWVKDLRSRTPDKGRQYFAHRMLTKAGKEGSSKHWPMEIAFNYSGQEKKSVGGDTGALLQAMEGVSSKFDIDPTLPRFALFEISAGVFDDSLKVSFSFPQNIRRQHSIKLWMSALEKALRRSSEELLKVPSGSSLDPFPLLPLMYNGTKKLQEKINAAGIASLANVEDVYGSSPMQRGVLLSQVKNPKQYMYQAIFVPRLATPSAPMNATKLADAWQMVVKTHPSLRTVFIESLAKEGLMDQAVVKTIEPKIVMLQAHAANAVEKLRDQESITFSQKQPHHQFTICETTTGKMFCKLELSHSICDGTSVSIILRDLARFYDMGSEIIEPAPTNRAYISYLQKSSYEADATYWRRYLQNTEPCSFPSLLDGAVQERKNRTCQLKLENLPVLNAFCAQNGATLSNVLQLVWSLVLRVYTGNENICFGYITSGRDVPVPGIQDTVGLFISMLVCHLELGDELKVNKALEQIQSDYSDSMGHQAFSLSNMQHEMGGGQALFNTVFTFQRRFKSSEEGSEKLEYDVISAYDPGEYPLTVNVEVMEHGIDVQFNYWTDFLCESQVSNVSDTFEQILQSIMDPASSGLAVGGIAFCSEKHQQRIFDWNDNPLPKVDRCVHDIIYQQSQTLPLSAPAVCSWDENLTYVKLMSLAKRLAKHLVALGVGPETYVPLCFEKSTWAVVAILGVLEAGGAFVPVEPSHPDSRIQYIISNVGAKLVLCSARYTEKFDGMPDVDTFVVDEGFPRRPQPNVPSGVVKKPTPANAAYLIFTSGTTGLPKGTIISHHAFATGATSHAPAILMRQTARVLQFSNLCFDASVMEILTTLITGACICIPSDEERMNNISGAVNRMNVTWTLLTPSVANMLVPENVPSLEVLVTGGEAMQARHIAKWSKSTALVNAYGPSECAVIATTSIKVDLDRSILDEDSSNIGGGVGCRCWIVNPHDHNQLMPIGSVGELVVEGNTVARGYLNNEEKTAKAFVTRPDWMSCNDDEIVAGHSRMIYKTGDLVRYNAAGNITYVARKDTQIKLNGLRIELGDIEHHVKECLPDGTEAAVEMAAPAGQPTALAAFISSKADSTSTEALILPMSDKITSLGKDLKIELTKALPGYMVPTLYFPVSKMPWTASGKLDRAKLRKAVTTIPQEDIGPYRLASSSIKKQTQQPSTDMERSLQRLWASFLGIKPESISTSDNFFAIGGDSVVGMKLGSAARAERISLSVFDIFRKPTLGEMAEACTVLEEEKETVASPFSLLGDSAGDLDHYLDEVAGHCRVSKEQVANAYPCSPLQEGLITISTRQAGAYVAHNAFRLPELVDTRQFQAAWQIAVDEMDILRTRVVHTSLDTFVQVVLSRETIDWHFAKSIDEASSLAQLPEHNGGPLTRFAIVDGAERYFVWSTHHAIYDGWSMPRMLQRVEDIYCQSSLQPTLAPYANYIGYLMHADKDASHRFWQDKFRDLESYHFPPALQNTAVEQGVDFKTLSHAVKLPNKPKITGITLPTLIRGAWAILLSAHTGGSEDVVFGESLTGRDLPLDGIIDMLGPTLTTVPSRVRVKRELTIAEFLQNVHREAAEIIPHQHIGLQYIKRLNAETALAADFRNLLVIQSGSGEDDVGGSKFWEPQDSGVSSKFFDVPLVLECDANGLSIRLNFHYNEAQVSNWLIERMVHQLEHVLTGLCAAAPESGARLRGLEIVSKQDIEVLQKWNSHQPKPVQNHIGELFLQQAKRAPYTQAVCAWDGSFTYRELKKQVELLAGHLRHLGVKPETLVPFCMDKSRWAVVVQLGIMLAGGAMVPLDPSHPLGRHEDVIQDTGARLLVCSPQYTDRYRGLTDTVVPVDEQSLLQLPKLSSGAAPFAQISSKNAAYCIFTSGSTGRPKGVIVEHEAFCSSSEGFCKAMLMDSNSRVFNFASSTFDASLMEIISPLTIGACICIPNNEEKMSDLASAFNSVRPTWAFLTPSVANIIHPSDVPSLKVLVVGGETLSEELVLKWGESVTLIEGYGPTEACVIAVTNREVFKQKDPKNLGYAHDSGRIWITDAADHNRLAPLGCIGELSLEGPILAREYLHDQEKTAQAFIEDPAWGSRVGSPQRLYKTGDLVKYNADGSIDFCGRKDYQIKLNGQRIELGEIESRFLLNERIQHALVVLPREGLCKGRLVAVLTLADIAPTQLGESAARSDNVCTLVHGTQLKTAQAYLTSLRDILAETLPAHMIPAMWAIVESVPISTSGKADKKQVERWIAGLDENTYKQITTQESTGTDSTTEMTITVQRLREIWAAVFNRTIEQIDPSRSFMSQGGDSLLSMSIVSRCRKNGISVTLQAVLQSKTLFQLAKSIDANRALAKPTDALRSEEKIDQTFQLSPVQQLYFRVAGPSSDYTRNGRFNQSQILKVSRRTSTDAIKHALEIIVRQHSMFRARFFIDQQNTWKQKIVASTANAYRLQAYEIDDLGQMIPAVANSQTSLNIEEGPLLAVDLFSTRQGEQILSLVAHHLIIDVVSWNIVIQQLETLLTSKGDPVIEKPLSFQVWLQMQQNQSHQGSAKTVLPFEIGTADLGFWDMATRSNVYGDTRSQGFTLKRSYTDSVLGASNNTYRTQPIELLLSSVIYSFNRVFQERSAPVVFNESHGRETWDGSIDLSGTTGWFTSLCPMHIPVDSREASVLDMVKRAKDQRRSIPGSGRDYFAYRFLTQEGRKEFADHDAMEILFNYTGRSQQGESGSDSLLQPMDIQLDEKDEKLTGDVGPETKRLALIEISAAVTDGQLRISFIYNKHMKHHIRIGEWVTECQRTLEDMTGQLLDAAPEPTLSDFPLLPTNATGLARHFYETLPDIGISSMEEVEDVMVCAPMQEGLLLSQIRQPDNYLSYMIAEVKLGRSGLVDVPRLVRAWQKVVDHHQMLRTTFVYSVCQGHAFDQVVMKYAEGGAKLVQCKDEEVEAEFAKISLRAVNADRTLTLPHQLTICTTNSRRVFMKLELNHAVIDGISVGVVRRDLAAAYQDQLEGTRPLYSDYIKYIIGRSLTTTIRFWTGYLKGVTYTHLPPLSPSSREKNRLNAIYLPFDRFVELQSFCRTNELTLSNVMLAAWALVLRRYTSQDDICFGNLSAGRDAPVEGIQNTVGAFVNMLVCRVDFAEQKDKTLTDVFRKVQSDFVESVPYQQCPLARIQHDLDLPAGEAMFNTACSLQSQAPSSEQEEEADTLRFEEVAGHDPTEYAVTVNINTAFGFEGACIKHWTSHVSVSEAEALAKVFADVLDSVLTKPEQTIGTFQKSQSVLKVKEKPRRPQAARAASGVRFQAGTKGPPATVADSAVDPTNIPAETYRKIIKDCVHEALEQLVKSGEYTIQKKSDQVANVVSASVDENLKKEQKFSDPADGTYKTLRSLWSSLLDIPEQKIHDDHSFLELGGDSIQAMELASSAQNAGLQLTVADIFNKPIFSEMAHLSAVSTRKRFHKAAMRRTASNQAAISEQRNQERRALFSDLGAADVETFIQDYICPRIGVFRGGITDVLPVTDFQALCVTGAMLKSRWLLNYFFFDGQGYLDLTRLKRSVFKLVQSFDILRTVFVHCGDRFWQVVLRKLRPQFQVYETDEDLDVFTRNLRESSIDAYPRLGEAYVQFSVVKKRGTSAHRLILRLSHAQYDGICLPKIIEALKACYEGKEVTLSPSFSNYVLQATGPANLKSYDYWKGLLRGSSMTSIPQREQPNYNVSDQGSSVMKKTIRLPALNSKGVTPATIFKAAWALTLAQLTGRTDIVFGNLISGRNAAVYGVEDLVGPCVNIIPVRITLGAKATALDLLRMIQGQQVTSMPHESLGFREIIQQCTDWPEWTHFSSIVQHQNISQEMPLRLDGRQYKLGLLGSGDNLSDFNLLSTPKEGGMVEIALGTCSDGTIPTALVQKALDMTCSFAENLARSPSDTLPSFLADTTRKPTFELDSPIKQITEQEKPSASNALNANLRGLRKRDVYAMVDTLRRSWRNVLPKDRALSSSEINPDTSFYALGGDIIAMGALYASLLDEGYTNIQLEDLIKSSTMGEQIALLSTASRSRRQERKGGSESELNQSSTSTLAETPENAERSPERAAEQGVIAAGEAKTKEEGKKSRVWNRVVRKIGIGRRAVDGFILGRGGVV